MPNAVQLADETGANYTAANPLPITGGGGGDASAANQVTGNEELADILAELQGDTPIGQETDPAPATSDDSASLIAETKLVAALLENKGLTIIPTCDTNILAAGDIIFPMTEIPLAVRTVGGLLELRTLICIDKNNQRQAIELYFSQVNTSLGTLNAAPSMAAADGVNSEGTFIIGSGDFTNLTNFAVATLRGIFHEMQAGVASRGIFFGGICRSGTPTYAADGLIFKPRYAWTS